MRTWALGIAALLTSAISIQTGFSETVTLTANGMVAGVTGLNVNINNVGTTNEAGLFQWTVSGAGDVGGTSVGPTGTQISTFCIQVGQSFSSGSTYSFNVVSINGSNPVGGVDAGYIDSVAAGQMQLLTDRYGKYLSLSGTQSINGSTYSAGEVAAAFQLSLWEIEYDGGSGKNSYYSYTPESYPGANYYSTGNMTASAAYGSSGYKAIGLSSYFLSQFTLGTTGVDSVFASYALTNGSAQDQFLGVPNAVPQVTAVPLPAALPLGASLLVGLGVIQKIRSRRRA
jgi:hypothetical protein